MKNLPTLRYDSSFAVQTLLRGENDSKQSDEIQAKVNSSSILNFGKENISLPYLDNSDVIVVSLAAVFSIVTQRFSRSVA